jgi:hypothetical protein
LKNSIIRALAAAELQRKQLLQGPLVPQNDDHKAAVRPEQSAGPARFGRYPCATSDCAEDKAGYHWAQEHGVTDPDSCTGNSGAFIEGCRVYAARRSATD